MISTIVTSDRFVPGVPDVGKWDKWTSGQVDKLCITIAI